MKLWGEAPTAIEQRNTVAVYGNKFELLGKGYYAPNMEEYTIEITDSGVIFFAVLVDALGCPRAMLRLSPIEIYKGDTFKLRPPPDIERKVDEHEKNIQGESTGRF